MYSANLYFGFTMFFYWLVYYKTQRSYTSEDNKTWYSTLPCFVFVFPSHTGMQSMALYRYTLSCTPANTLTCRSRISTFSFWSSPLHPYARLPQQQCLEEVLCGESWWEQVKGREIIVLRLVVPWWRKSSVESSTQVLFQCDKHPSDNHQLFLFHCN